jgi:hypothetical protein
MKKFKPFIFKIKTEKEARVLWHILNCPMSGTSKHKWLEAQNIFEAMCVNGRLWERFNETYPLKGE